MPNNATRSTPTASITARMSSILCSRVGISLTRSERPVPLLSNQIILENEASRSRPAATLVLPKRIRCVIPSLELQPNPLVLFRRLDTLCELLRSLRILSQESFWVCLDQALRLFHKRRLSPLILLYPSKYQGTPPGRRGEEDRNK